MSAKNIAVAFGLAVFLAGGAVAAEADKDEDKAKDPDRVTLEWKRDPKLARRPVDAGPPPASEPPQELAAVPSAAVQPAPAAAPSIDAAAGGAANEMAREAARSGGRREYWRAGFARGVTAALDEKRLGAADHAAGVSFGRVDPRAKPLGNSLAKEEAEFEAEDTAEERVAERFMDLSVEPRLNRRDLAMRKEKRYGPAVPDFEGPYAVAPVLADVFASHPPTRAAGLSPEGRRAIDAWRVAPATLGSPDRQAKAYDSKWKDPEVAFAKWKEHGKRDSAYSRWSPAEREQFHASFVEKFASALRSMDERLLNEAWRIGFADGWRYGAAIHAEWAYRRGYAEGFDAAVREAGTIEFPYAYERAYNQAYAKAFEHWSRTAYPGLGQVRLADETDDGIYEPGERVLIAAEAVNFGGGFGMFDLVASGKNLTESGTAKVRLVGRGRMPDPQKLSVQIADDVAPRTSSKLTVKFGDEQFERPLWISRPFEVADAPTIAADRLEGRVTLSLSVHNTSRRDAEAVVRIDPLTGVGEAKREDVGIVPSGGSKRVTATFQGIHPLDLIGAESRWRISIARGDRIDDTREVSLAPVATDLTSPDLLDFTLALARTPGVSSNDARDSRDLIMQRLTADWERAVDAGGNPYKRDYEAEGTETVLGQLVRIRKAGRTYASPQVFDGMDKDVDALVDDLPGAHPLLKKWMRKLAKQLT